MRFHGHLVRFRRTAQLTAIAAQQEVTQSSL